MAALLIASPASAQEYSDWIRHRFVGDVEFSYSYMVTRDEVRVKWRCKNYGGEPVTCVIGGEDEKTYNCVRNAEPVATSRALAEQATVRPGEERIFMPDTVCRGAGATSVGVHWKTSFSVE